MENKIGMAVTIFSGIDLRVCVGDGQYRVMARSRIIPRDTWRLPPRPSSP